MLTEMYVNKYTLDNLGTLNMLLVIVLKLGSQLSSWYADFEIWLHRYHQEFSVII